MSSIPDLISAVADQFKKLGDTGKIYCQVAACSGEFDDVGLWRVHIQTQHPKLHAMILPWTEMRYLGRRPDGRFKCEAADCNHLFKEAIDWVWHFNNVHRELIEDDRMNALYSTPPTMVGTVSVQPGSVTPTQDYWPPPTSRVDEWLDGLPTYKSLQVPKLRAPKDFIKHIIRLRRKLQDSRPRAPIMAYDGEYLKTLRKKKDTFPLFASFPAEIRLRVWGYNLPEPNVLTAMYDKALRKTRSEARRATWVFMNKIKHPFANLHICQESRFEAIRSRHLEGYESVCLENISHWAWFNPKTDTYFLNTNVEREDGLFPPELNRLQNPYQSYLTLFKSLPTNLRFLSISAHLWNWPFVQETPTGRAFRTITYIPANPRSEFCLSLPWLLRNVEKVQYSLNHEMTHDASYKLSPVAVLSKKAEIYQNVLTNFLHLGPWPNAHFPYQQKLVETVEITQKNSGNSVESQ